MVRVPNPVVALALVLAILLSGCSQDSAGGEHSPPPVTAVTPDLADVRGVVVDEAVRPVANATVELAGHGLNTTTDSQGVFHFDRLPPGLATVRASAPGFLASQATVDLVGGKVAAVKVLLMTDPSMVGYQTLHHWQGFIEVSGSLATFAVDLFAQGFLNQSLCQCTFFFTIDEQPAAYVYEVYLAENLPAGPLGNSSYYWELIASAADSEIESAYDEIPIYQVINGTVFPEEREEITARVTGPALWPSFQQEYDLFVTVFYRVPPPDGWRAATVE